MKKTLVSLAAVAALTTGAMAADKGIDFTTTGQAVVYYNTLGNNSNGNVDLFEDDGKNTKASYGIQLNLDADLKNGFTFGSTLNYLGTLGLEKNLVGATMQNTNDGLAENNIADDIYLAQIYIAKKMGNTTLKLGRQELPKSLSPFAYSEGWNVFKNTFDAMLVVNTDIPDTAVVGAYVAKGNGNGFGNNMSSFGDLETTVGDIKGEAYMLTIQNKSIPMTTLTASYYSLAKVAASDNTDASYSLNPNTGVIELNPATVGSAGVHADIFWLDASVAGKDMPLGLKFGVQGGQIKPDSTLNNKAGVKLADVTDTTAYGVKVGLAPLDGLSFCLAYTSVDGDDNKANVAIKNTTGVKTPLYTQMIANQNAIALDSNTIMLKAAYNTGDYGKIIAQYGATAGGKSSLVRNNSKDTDFGEFDLIYKVKAANINWLAAWVNQSWSEKGAHDKDSQDILRLVARYNF